VTFVRLMIVLAGIVVCSASIAQQAPPPWRYGAFLAQTAEHEKSIPYLQKAASLGVVDAHYTAAMVFMSLNDQTHAKIELKEYVKANPKDKAAKQLLADMEHGDRHIHIHDGPPPQGVVAPAHPE
jgi:hypothetical protein